MQVLTYPYADDMPASSEETRGRLERAAAQEFAAHGLAGARTSRIASTAGANEALLFRYFGGKQAMFEHVFSALISKTVDDVPLDASDLGSYAGALFDYYREHEQVLRLAVWAALESSQVGLPAGLTSATAAKEQAVAAAQRAGLVSSRLAAGELLALVVQLSLSGASVSPALGPAMDADIRRASIVTAVRALTAP